MTPFPTPQEKDTLSSELPEEKMINEGYRKDPGNFWAWILIAAAITALIWGTLSQYTSYMQETTKPRPFLQVTNREMSRFLWQNPEFMRATVTVKSGYLPAFAVGEGMRLDPSLANDWAIVPPEVLFRYHTWQRLLGGIWFSRPIPAGLFMAFLQAAPEWSPYYWKAAPASYTEFLESLDHNSTLDLSALQPSTLPLEVRTAFQGWQNFYYEGKQIEAYEPTFAEVKRFLELYPTYGRSYWQNIVDNSQGHYLGSLATHAADDMVVPHEELTPFLRVALYNARESQRAKAGR